MERGAQIGGKGLIAFRGRVRTITTEVSTGWHRPAPPSFTANQMHPANVGLMLWPRRSRAQHWLNVPCFHGAYLIRPPQYYWLGQCWYNSGSPPATLSYHETNLHKYRICWDKTTTIYIVYHAGYITTLIETVSRYITISLYLFTIICIFVVTNQSARKKMY